MSNLEVPNKSEVSSKGESIQLTKEQVTFFFFDISICFLQLIGTILSLWTCILGFQSSNQQSVTFDAQACPISASQFSWVLFFSLGFHQYTMMQRVVCLPDIDKDWWRKILLPYNFQGTRMTYILIGPFCLFISYFLQISPEKLYALAILKHYMGAEF